MRYLQGNKELNKKKLDSKDKKILFSIAQDARMPLTKISKEIQLSRDAVSHRIKNYEKQGIIQGYRTIVNVGKLGYNSSHLFVKLNNPPKIIEEEIVMELQKTPYIRAILKFTGNFDYEIAFIHKDIQDFDEKTTEILCKFGNFLKDHELLIISKTFAAETFPPNFTEKELYRYSKPKTKKTKVDKIDIEILKLLSENATMPIYEIGEKVKLSSDAISYRIKNMLDSGLIIKFIPVINYSSLDYHLYAVLLNIKNFTEEKELRSLLTANKNTLWAVKTIGRYNVLMYLLVKSIDDVQETLFELKEKFPERITHNHTLIAYEEYKYIYFPRNLDYL